MATRLAFSVLGPVAVTSDGEPVRLGGPKQAAVLAILLLEPNRVVSSERLVDGVWGDEAHDRAPSTLQVYVSNLRKLLGAERILTERPGYRLVAAEEEVDLLRFVALAAAGDGHAAAGQMAPAAARYREALAEWTGEPFADLAYEPFAATAAVGLEQRRDVVRESAFDAELAMGRHRELVGELEDAVARTPLRERRWGQLCLALYRSGRQADALAAYGRARRVLVDELGLEPGAELRALESAILAQDPSLDWSPAGATLGAETTVRRPPSDGAPVLLLPNGSRLDLGDQAWTIGRSPDSDIVLASPDVSRRHAELRPTEHGWVVSDLGSTNGMSVNGTTVAEFQLGDGDVIAVGRHELVFLSGSGIDRSGSGIDPRA